MTHGHRDTHQVHPRHPHVDVTTAAATTDITACSGTLANALTLGPALSAAQPSLLGAAAKWDRVLTAGELARLPALLGA